MKSAIRHILFACLFTTTGLFSGIALADQLVMDNGDVINGNIKRIEDDKVYIEPPYADEFSVKLKHVVSITADDVFDIEIKDDGKLDGQFAGGSEGQQTLIVQGESMEVPLMQIGKATEPDKYFDHSSHIDLSLTFNGGNTDSKNNMFYADTSIKVGDHRHNADLTFRRDETDNESTKKQDLLRYSWNWLFSDPWYTGITTSYERDPIKDLDHRYTIGGIIGRDIFSDYRKLLTANAGIGYSEEKLKLEKESGATGFWQLKYEHDFRNGDLTIFHNQDFLFQFYGDNNSIFKTNTGFRFDIYKDIYSSVSLRYDYETEPALGAKNHDTTLAVGLGAKF
jgi:hypothetical protein